MERKFSNSEYSSGKYHDEKKIDKGRDNYLMYMSKRELMDYFYKNSNLSSEPVKQKFNP